MFIQFSEEVQKILKNAKKEMLDLKHPFIGSEHLLLSILNNDNKVSNILKKYNVNYNNFKKELIKKVGLGQKINNYYVYTPLLKRILDESILDAKESGLSEITINLIFREMLDEGEGVGFRILKNLGVDINKLYSEINCISKKRSNKKLILHECSIDLNKKCLEKENDPLIGRDNEVDELINILLRRNKNNPLLIGEAGVGKTAIVEELANRINNGNVPDKLKNKHILSLSMASLVSGTKYRGEFEERVNKILKELEDHNDIIIFIDEIHTLVGAGGAEGAIDASNILKPSLARGNIKVIGATTIKEYKESICKDKALNRRFQTIFINENTIDETINILKQIKPLYEEYHHVKISDEIIALIVNLTDKYINDKCNPDKAIDILDMVCTKVSLKENKNTLIINNLKKELCLLKEKKNYYIMHQQYPNAEKIKGEEIKISNMLMEIKKKKNNKKVINKKDVKEIIEKKTKIPIYEVTNNKLINTEKYLKKKIIGQEEVINILSKITQKIMLGLKKDLPYSFLFIGPSGVGKTMLVKEYSKLLNIPLIRLDMSEYKENYSISKIIGSPPGYIGYDDFDNVLEKIKNNPYCVILLDEIEKACSEVLNLFLQVLDEGIITDSHGNKVNLKNTIIIMTSNIGSERKVIGFNNQNIHDEIKDYLSIPLINRINTICYFNQLNKENIRLILKNKIIEMQNELIKKNIHINVDKNIIDEIINVGEIETYGARKVLKILEEKIDDIVINNHIMKKRCTLT